MNLTLVTAPASEPLTTAEAKAQMRVDISDDDTIIDAFVSASREAVEGYLRRSLITQTWRLVLDEWPDSRSIFLPRPPLQSVTSVVYTDKDGNSNTLSSSNYIVDVDGSRVVLKHDYVWPTVTLQAAAGIAVTYIAGYGNASTSVPERFVSAIRLMAADLYENREATIIAQGVSVVEYPVLTRLLQPYRSAPMGGLK